MRHSVNLLLPAAVLALAACGKGDSAMKTEEGKSMVQVPQGTGEAATTIHLVVQGGPHAGTYDAKSSDITPAHTTPSPATSRAATALPAKGPGVISTASWESQATSSAPFS
jgi:hypothetical protein